MGETHCLGPNPDSGHPESAPPTPQSSLSKHLLDTWPPMGNQGHRGLVSIPPSKAQRSETGWGPTGAIGGGLLEEALEEVLEEEVGGAQSQQGQPGGVSSEPSRARSLVLTAEPVLTGPLGIDAGLALHACSSPRQ